MKLTRKVYENRNQKVLDFVIGFVGWFLINGLLYTCSLLLLSNGTFDIEQEIWPIVLLALPLVLNIAALIFLAFTRRWIALGALAAFALTLVGGLLIGLVIYTVCLNTGNL
jgi:hypothetical protein